MPLQRAGHGALIIRGHQLNFNELEKKLGMKARNRDKKREGDEISKVRPPLSKDVISFKEFINKDFLPGDVDSPDDVVNSFVSYLLATQYDFSELSKTCDVILNCFLHSDYEHIGIDFTPETIHKIGMLGLGFEISFISGTGMYVDEEEEEAIIE